MALMASLLVYLEPAVGPPLLGLSLTGIVCVVLFLPQRSAVCRDGVALRGSFWDQTVGGKRRWVPMEKVLAVWPIVRFQRSNHTRILAAYGILFDGGVGRVYATSGLAVSAEAGRALATSLEAALGRRWSSVHTALPLLGPGIVSDMAAALSESYRARISRSQRELLLAVVVGGLVFLPAFLLWSLDGPGGFVWTLVVLGAGIFGAAYLRDLRIHEPAVERDFEAFSLYLRVRDYEGSTGRRLLPNLAVHPDYAILDPEFPDEVADYRLLQEDLETRDEGRALFVGGLAIVLVTIFVLWIVVDLPLTPTVLGMAIAAMIGAPVAVRGAKRLASAFAASYIVEGILREEWKTGSSILPASFVIPESSGFTRNPENLDDTTVRRMRRAAWVDSSRVVLYGLPGGVAVMFVLVFASRFLSDGNMIFQLGFGGLAALAAIAGGLFVFTDRGRRALASIEDFEEVTRKQVMPPDLRELRNRAR